MQYDLCRHIRTNGRQCASPSLVTGNLCYFHTKLHRRHRNLHKTLRFTCEPIPNPPGSAESQSKNMVPSPLAHDASITLPPLEDAESIQVSISLLVTALAANQIEASRARVLLYGLQLASANARLTTIEPTPAAVIRSIVHTKSGLDLAARYPGVDDGG